MIGYENSKGTLIEFDTWPLVIDDITELYGKEWKYETTENKNSNEAMLEKFYRTSVSKKITLQVYADSEVEFCNVMNNISEATDVDVIEKTPGKLWVGDYYLECYITETNPKDYDDIFYATDLELKIEAFYPFWINKNTFDFHKYNISSENNKKYPDRYPYRYVNGSTGDYVINPHFTDANFELIIYGSVVNPQIQIGKNVYLVNITLGEGEYLRIDSRKKIIIKTDSNGGKSNAYHYRKKGTEFFKKIAPGRQDLIWPGTYDFDLIIYEERSEPKWKPI